MTSGLLVAVFEERTPGHSGQKRRFYRTKKSFVSKSNHNLTTGLNLKTYNTIQVCGFAERYNLSIYYYGQTEERSTDELQSFRIAGKTSENLSSPDVVDVESWR